MANTIRISSEYQRALTMAQASTRGQESGGTADNQHSSKRTVHDTVEISPDGTKAVNLARASQLADALPDATTDRKAFDIALEKSLEDVNRITSLFGGVLAGLRQSQAPSSNALSSPTDLTDNNQQAVSNSHARELVERLHQRVENTRDFGAHQERSGGKFQQFTSLLGQTIKSILGRA